MHRIHNKNTSLELVLKPRNRLHDQDLIALAQLAAAAHWPANARIG